MKYLLRYIPIFILIIVIALSFIVLIRKIMPSETHKNTNDADRYGNILPVQPAISNFTNLSKPIMKNPNLPVKQIKVEAISPSSNNDSAIPAISASPDLSDNSEDDPTFIEFFDGQKKAVWIKKDKTNRNTEPFDPNNSIYNEEEQVIYQRYSN